MLTVLFSDVEGSTELRTRRGDEVAQGILRAHEALVREAVAQHGGREIKALGDGFMIAFGSVRRGIACAIDLQGAQARRNLGHPLDAVSVRVGLNTGEVSEEEGDLYGETVHAAARIAATAAGGEIVCADVVRQLAGTVPRVSFSDRGLVALKGFSEARQLWRVDCEESMGVLPASRAPFVARDAERAELLRWVEATRQGHGAVVLIGGEPGVGKTRLAEELAREAEKREMRVRIGHCYEMDGAPPYNPFVEMLEAVIQDIPADLIRQTLADDAAEIARVMPKLRRLFPDIPPPLELPPEQERKVLLDALRSFIARGATLRPQLLVLDDLHWADEGTLLLLRHLAEEIETLPVLIVGTYREVELDAARPFARALEALLRGRQAHRVPLKRLSEESVEALLASLGGQLPPAVLLRAIYAETEGNPFFVEEVFKHLLEEGRLMDEHGRFRPDLVIGEVDVPEGVRLVIGRRVERLGEQALQVLTAAAVIGHGFTFELLDAITELDTDAVLDAVDEAQQARIVGSEQIGGEARIVFSHELIRQTLLARLSLPRRQRFHLRVAEAIEKLSALTLDEHIADLAYHFAQAGAAGDQTKTLRYSMLAGERALEAAASEDALAHFERALALEEAANDDTMAVLLEDLGFARRSVGDLDEAVVTWGRALDVYERLGEPEKLGRLAAEVASQLSWVARFAEGVAVAGRGLEALGQAETPDRCRLLVRAAITISIAGDHDTAAGMIDEALGIAEHRADDNLRALALYSSGLHHWAWCRAAESLLALETSVELFKRTGMAWDLTNAAVFLSYALITVCRLNDVVAVAEEHAPQARRIGNRNTVGLFGFTEAFVNVCRDADLAAWERSLHTGLEITVGPARSYFLAGLAYAEFCLGNWEDALERFDEPTDFPGVLGGGIYGRALVQAYLGDRDGAADTIEANRQVIARVRQPNAWRNWSLTCIAIECFYLLRQYEEAAALRPLVEEAVRTGVEWRNVGFPVLTRTVAAMAAGAASDWNAAEMHYEKAIQLAEQLPHLIEQANARRFYTQMFLDRDRPGDRERARVLAAEAIERYDRIGMPRHAVLTAALIERA